MTLKDVTQQREAAARSSGLAEDERAEILRLCDQAAQALQQEIRWRAQQVGHRRTKAVVENELASTMAATLVPLPGPPPEPPSETVQQVDEERTRVRNDRASLLKRRDDLNKLRTTLGQRAEAIPARRAEIGEKLQSLEDEISVLKLASASPLWEQASRLSLLAQRQSLQQELAALDLERESLNLRRQLIPLQRESYLLKLEGQEKYLAELNGRRNKARIQDAKRSLDTIVGNARGYAKDIPQLAGLAGEVEQRAVALWGPDGIEAKSDRVAAQAEQMKGALGQFREITENTRRRWENSGLFSSAAEWWPPRVRGYGKPAEAAAASLSLAAAETIARRDLFRLEEERNAMPPFETELSQMVSASGIAAESAQYAVLQSRARSLLQLKRTLATDFLVSERAYLNELDEAHQIADDLRHSMRDLNLFVVQRALWSRSVTGPVLPSPSGILNAIAWFFSGPSWAKIGSGLTAAEFRTLLWWAGLAAVLLLLVYRAKWEQLLARPVLQAPRTTRFRTLLTQIAIGFLAAAPVPLAIAYVGWMIGRAAPEEELAQAIEAGAAQAARVLLLAILVRRILAPGAAAEGLLGWRREVRENLDRTVQRLTQVVTPLLFVVTALAEVGMLPSSDPLLQSHHNSLGRLCFLIVAAAFLISGRSTFRIGGPVATAVNERRKAGLPGAHTALILITLIFSSTVVLALAGYYITAYLLLDNVLKMAAFTFALVLVSAVIGGWRRDQEDRLAAALAPKDQGTVRESDTQVRRLSRFGLTLVWMTGTLIIWSAALPALSILKRVELLPEFRIRPETASAAPVQSAPPEAAKPKAEEEAAAAPVPLPVPAPANDGQPAKPAEPRKPMYLSDLLLAVFVTVLAAMVVGNIPGLLRFTLLRRMSLDTGGQYAVNTIARYVVIIVGLILVSGILGLNWSKVQWLAAALTFGIGFGLQEIFANFAAGLILLVDRSIRVGDAVTVGNLSGVVSRIQMRATTVTLWDHSDMVVPNKEFITTKLVNWTLSNADTRVDLKVGVSYGSNVEEVREVLLQIAAAHPAVLKEPAPQVLLTEFAGSSINFELRVFALYSYGRPVLLDELHRTVVREFRERNIEIAFPQLDVNLKPQPAAAKPDTAGGTFAGA